jgi:hypothetical protein
LTLSPPSIPTFRCSKRHISSFGPTYPVPFSKRAHVIEVNKSLESLCHEMAHFLDERDRGILRSTLSPHEGWDDEDGFQTLCDVYENGR